MTLENFEKIGFKQLVNIRQLEATEGQALIRAVEGVINGLFTYDNVDWSTLRLRVELDEDEMAWGRPDSLLVSGRVFRKRTFENDLRDALQRAWR